LSLGPTGHKIFSDVWDLAPLFSSDGYRYFVIFVDAYTKYVWYYPIIFKSDVYSVFHQFQTLVERQFSLKKNLFKLIGAVNTANYPYFFKLLVFIIV